MPIERGSSSGAFSYKIAQKTRSALSVGRTSLFRALPCAFALRTAPVDAVRKRHF